KDERRANELQCVCVGGEIRLELPRQVRLGSRKGFIEDQEDFLDLGGSIGRHGLFENEVGGFEDVLGEEHAQIIADLNGFSHGRHALKVERVGRDFEFNLG